MVLSTAKKKIMNTFAQAFKCKTICIPPSPCICGRWKLKIGKSHLGHIINGINNNNDYYYFQNPFKIIQQRKFRSGNT